MQLGPLALYSSAPASLARPASPLIHILLLVQLGPLTLIPILRVQLGPLAPYYSYPPASPARPTSPDSYPHASPARPASPFGPLLLLAP